MERELPQFELQQEQMATEGSPSKLQQHVDSPMPGFEGKELSMLDLMIVLAKRKAGQISAYWYPRERSPKRSLILIGATAAGFIFWFALRADPDGLPSLEDR
jgi:hypothetical protein